MSSEKQIIEIVDSIKSFNKKGDDASEIIKFIKSSISSSYPRKQVE